jgi:ribosome-associated translation inhibitor RaiA
MEAFMKVLVTSDHHIVGGEDMTERLQGLVESRLDRFEEQVMRVEVHLSDFNIRKPGGRDMRCRMEARMSEMRPIAVSYEASTLSEAIHTAADKLERAVEDSLERLNVVHGRMASEPPAPPGSGIS